MAATQPNTNGLSGTSNSRRGNKFDYVYKACEYTSVFQIVYVTLVWYSTADSTVACSSQHHIGPCAHRKSKYPYLGDFSYWAHNEALR